MKNKLFLDFMYFLEDLGEVYLNTPDVILYNEKLFIYQPYEVLEYNMKGKLIATHYELSDLQEIAMTL